jgi:hypothetical protein
VQAQGLGFFIIFNHFLFNILIITAVNFFYRSDSFGRASGAGATNNAIASMHIAWQDLTHWTAFSTWKSLSCHSSWRDSIVLLYHPECVARLNFRKIITLQYDVR